MSSLVMALVAGMAVGDGPERITTVTEQRLCLEGDWTGVWKAWYLDNDEGAEAFAGPQLPCHSWNKFPTGYLG